MILNGELGRLIEWRRRSVVVGRLTHQIESVDDERWRQVEALLEQSLEHWPGLRDETRLPCSQDDAERSRGRDL